MIGKEDCEAFEEFMDTVREVGDKAMQRVAEQRRPMRTPEEEAEWDRACKMIEEEAREAMRWY